MKTKNTYLMAVFLLIFPSCVVKQDSGETMSSDKKSLPVPASLTISDKGADELTKQNDFESTLALLKHKRFKHTCMPKFSKDLDLVENDDAYSEYLKSLALPGTIPVDYFYLGLGDSEYRVIYENPKVDPNLMPLIVMLDSPKELFQRASRGGPFVCTGLDSLDEVKICLPRPETFVSKDIWDLIYVHEQVHAHKIFQGILSPEKQEVSAYEFESQILKGKDPKVFELFVNECGKFYRRHGFCQQLQKLCMTLYQTETLSPLERDLIEPGLMFMLAMNVDGIKEKDESKVTNLFSDLVKYVASNECL